MRRLPFASAVLLLASFVDAQVDIEFARWGFDGKAVSGQFNLLTLHVSNRSPKPFDGVVQLVKSSGLGRFGARHAVPCFLAPGSSRLVQFYPYVTMAGEDWRVDVGKTSMRFGQYYEDDGKNRKVESGLPATVLLHTRASLRDRGIGLPMFPEEEFPPSVTGTSGLARVVLDHVPVFQTAQERAFLDWLRGGGDLHLGHDAGEFPVFEGVLAVLNDPRDRFAVGSGSVTRHHRAFGRGDSIATLRTKRKPQDNRRAIAGQLLSDLREIVRPDHEWALIYLVIFVFFLAVVPWHAWFSFKRVGYLGSIASLLAIVAVTTWLLFLIGQRGYGEASAVHSLSYAKVLAPGRYDVTQFKNVFSTTSATHAIRHAASGSLYTTAEQNESVPGAVVLGADARFEVAIPLFTSRPFVHRGVFAGDELDVEVTSWPTSDTMDAAFGLRWNGPPVVKAMAFHGGYGVELGHADGKLFPNGRRRTIRRMIKSENDPNWGYNYGYRRFEPGVPAIQVVEPWFNRIVAEQWRAHSETFPGRVSDERSVRVVVLCEAPEFLKIDRQEGGSQVGDETGYVIYDVTLSRGE